MMRLVCSFLLTFLIAHFCCSATFAGANVEMPYEFSAAKDVEWNRNDGVLIARGDVHIQRGDMSFAAQHVQALYNVDSHNNSDSHSVSDGGMRFHTLKARDGVSLKVGAQSLYGARGDYFIDRSYVVFRGGDLRIESADQVIKAEDRFEYFINQGVLTARGGVVVIRPADRLYADEVDARLVEGAGGKQVLTQVIARGNVVIETDLEVIRARKGVYNAVSQEVELSGGVVIERGENKITGERAHVNLETKVSRLVGQGGSGGRVQGRFYPGQIKK